LYPGEFYFAFIVDGQRMTLPEFETSDFNGIPYNFKKITAFNHLFSKMKTHKIN
jgi:hypothetical protein